MLPTTIEERNLLQIARQQEVAFTAAIVGRDFLSSGLMVNALVNGLKCEAIPVQPTDLMRVLAAEKIDLAIISSNLDSKPGSGFELASQVSRAHPGMHILILLSKSTRETVVRAFQSGATAVLNRDEPMSALLSSVEHVRKGYIWAGREESSILIDVLSCLPSQNALSNNESSALSRRELQVVECAARGKTNRAIATELGLSEHTVKNYLFRAFEKLGISSRVELLFHLTLRDQSFGPPREILDESPKAETA